MSIGLSPSRDKARARRPAGDAVPIVVVVLVLLAVWYVAAALANWTIVADALLRAGEPASFEAILRGTIAAKRPILPAPHQIAGEMWTSIIATPVTSPRSLVFHAWVTLASTLVGFGIGALLGVALAVAIVHARALRKSLLPWIIASQTVPILAIAPIVIVVLGSLGLRGVLPKAVISAYLCFFPVTIGMVKGLNSPDVMQRDLMRTYCAGPLQTLWKLRLPASLPFLFASLKVAVAASLVGAIVGELPTGAQAGLGARLLVGSYYGQTVQIWAALLTAAIVSAGLVILVGLVERRVLGRMGMVRA